MCMGLRIMIKKKKKVSYRKVKGIRELEEKDVREERASRKRQAPGGPNLEGTSNLYSYVFVLFKQAEHMSTAWGKIRTGLLGAALNSSILSQGSANCASQAKFSPLSKH